MKKLVILFALATVFFSCKQKLSVSGQVLNRPPFEDIKGTKFIEVRRTFKNGYSFSKEGYQLEPEWVMFFMSDDSMQAYSDLKHRFIKFKITYSHDSVFNFAGQWFKLKNISKDSLMFQLLEVKNRNISKEWSNVYMSFYSENYIKDSLHSTAAILKNPRRKDSVYVENKSRIANLNRDSAFAARKPVVLKSRSPQLILTRVEPSKDPLDNATKYDEYYHPEYKILINNAYKDFNYYFNAIIDQHGKIWFKESLYVNIMPEFKESNERVTKGIIDVYLQRLLDITPGTTLGFVHPSTVTFMVVGKKK
jgi:hypothetical protein